MHLPVVVLHSRARTPQAPVFIFHGGPGLSNLQLQHSYAWALVNHDVVLLGYHGMDGSVSLAMPEVNALLKGVPDPLAPAALKELARAFDGAVARPGSEGIHAAEYNLAQVDGLWPAVVDLFNWGDLCLRTCSSQSVWRVSIFTEEFILMFAEGGSRWARGE
jgi:hypothetical protein